MIPSVGTTVIWTNDADTNQTILFTGPTDPPIWGRSNRALNRTPSP